MIDALRATIASCTACALSETRTTVVVGEFPPDARLLLVGEAPGAQEDATGRPFVGRGGQLLDSLLAEAGLQREECAVANVVKCRPPGNRTPSIHEMRTCSGWLDRQLEIHAPQLVVTLGGTALRWALGAGHRLTDVHGEVRPWRTTRLLPTYHPSAALRFGPNGTAMAMLRADLRTAAAAL